MWPSFNQSDELNLWMGCIKYFIIAKKKKKKKKKDKFTKPSAEPGGGHSNGKRGYQAHPWTVGHTNSTLITYFSGMKIDPKYAFLHAFFLICPSCPFQNLSIWPKTHPFFSILHVFAPLNDVREYSAWSWKTTLITWIFGRAWYPPWHSSGPRGRRIYVYNYQRNVPSNSKGNYLKRF